jgi:hypothetical protein
MYIHRREREREETEILVWLQKKIIKNEKILLSFAYTLMKKKEKNPDKQVGKKIIL